MPGCEMGRFGEMGRGEVLASIGPGLGGVALADGDFESSLSEEITRLSQANFPLERVEVSYGQFEERLQIWAGNAIWMR